jgi:hypothetical protein
VYPGYKTYSEDVQQLSFVAGASTLIIPRQSNARRTSITLSYLSLVSIAIASKLFGIPSAIACFLPPDVSYRSLPMSLGLSSRYIFIPERIRHAMGDVSLTAGNEGTSFTFPATKVDRSITTLPVPSLETHLLQAMKAMFFSYFFYSMSLSPCFDGFHMPINSDPFDVS